MSLKTTKISSQEKAELEKKRIAARTELEKSTNQEIGNRTIDDQKMASELFAGLSAEAQNAMLMRLVRQVIKDEKVKITEGDLTAYFNTDSGGAWMRGSKYTRKGTFLSDFQNGRAQLEVGQGFEEKLTVLELKRVIAHELTHFQQRSGNHKNDEYNGDTAAARTYGAQGEVDLLTKLGAMSPKNYFPPPGDPHPSIWSRQYHILKAFPGTEIIHLIPSPMPQTLNLAPPTGNLIPQSKNNHIPVKCINNRGTVKPNMP